VVKGSFIIRLVPGLYGADTVKTAGGGQHRVVTNLEIREDRLLADCVD